MDKLLSVKHEPKLEMTDYIFLFGMWLATLWTIDPFGWRLDFIGVVNRFPIILISPAFVLAFVGSVIFKGFRANASILKPINSTLVMLIFLFSAYVTTGSLFAKIVNNVDNVFLNMGTHSLTASFTIWYLRRAVNPLALVKATLYVYIFWATIAVGMQVINFKGVEVFHAREHLVIAGLSLFYFIANSTLAKSGALMIILFSAFVGQKNTAYMTALLCFFIFFIIWAVEYSKKINDKFKRWMFWSSSLFVIIFSASFVALIYFSIKSKLPDGNPVYRLYTYEKAWNKFLSSPIWGNGYTGPATEKFDLFTVNSSTQVLPTHSDPLDILANGGLIGILIWVSIFVFVFRDWFLLITSSYKPVDVKLIPYIHTLFIMIFAGLLVCAFNPILNTPNSAWAFWALVGMLTAINTPLGNYRSKVSI